MLAQHGTAMCSSHIVRVAATVQIWPSIGGVPLCTGQGSNANESCSKSHAHELSAATGPVGPGLCQGTAFTSHAAMDVRWLLGCASVDLR